jgi:hypothetical protein
MVAGRYVALDLGAGRHRLELPGNALGLPPPPVYTELTLGRARQGWSVRALAARPDAEGLARWLRSLGAASVEPVTAREPSLKAAFARLPDGLAFVDTLAELECVGLGSDGSAFLVARATKSKFQELLQQLESRRMAENAVPELTERQAELLQFCADRGYYDIPREANLRGLAAELGISPTALSRALRRAEARILSAYVERMRHNLPQKKPAKRARRAVP